MSNAVDLEKIKRFSADIRIWTLRVLAEAGFGHIGGSASLADVLAVLYGGVMKIDPKNPKWEERDWFVLSKGHCAPALYATLALKGFFPMDWLKTLNKGGTNLPSHADRLKVPGVDMSTGSLGQGLSAAVGIAYANRQQGRDNWIYCIMGDGECNEGQIWEACETANSLKLDHLIAFVDWNKKQLDGRLEDINDPVNIEEKFRAFGFDAVTVKGYDTLEIYKAVERAKDNPGKPHCIVLDTFKGLGVDFAEKVEFNHYLTFGPEEAEESIKEIERRYAEGTYPGGDLKW
ncbi:MAG TPA: transketolase [Candidatus Copromorpha excrementigallinarum]|uniref:Transketolase n=1 Tax=Candidatus Allocopromorpha excrementigallinarum TaxID=2840742 RepID=A0A9D1I061_9FIRM|nr:transketolase [Candidatus Copromorpha excrementigallinarum]